jgi:predicted Zn-dependent peptidase
MDYQPTGAAGAGCLPSLAFSRFRLDNGLTLVVHEDHKAPIVAVGLWYRVGSGDEPVGRHGFAHLFEHLMFSGSEHFNRSYFEAFSHVGATDLNGTTWFDRTNYFVTVPTSALDLALWMESDRMGHLLGAVDQEKLDMQRRIVRNEKMQIESRPYGKVDELVLRNNYPSNHPYAHTTLGLIEDLENSSLDDVKQWFRTHYGAANATLVLAGDITEETVREKVVLYFGDIDPGPPTIHPLPWTPERRTSVRGEVRDRVPYPMLKRQWNGPYWGHEDSPLLELAAWIVGRGVTSRLHRRLVHEAQLASSVVSSFPRFAVTRPFGITMLLAGESRVAEAEGLLDEELRRFAADGPTEGELELARGMITGGLARDLEVVGGLSGKAAQLAEGQALRGLPNACHADLTAMFEAGCGAVAEAVRRWINDNHYTLIVRPSKKHRGEANGIDGWPAEPRARIFSERLPHTLARGVRGAARVQGPPTVHIEPVGTFPNVEEHLLPNGLRILAAARPGSPITAGILNFTGGSSADPERLPGLAAFGAAAMHEGTLTKDAVVLQGAFDALGASIATQSCDDFISIAFDLPSYSLGRTIELLEELISHPAFTQQGLEQTRRLTQSRMRQAMADPSRVAQLVLPTIMFGPIHPYGRPGSGFGTVQSLASITATDVSGWHDRQFVPASACLSICGDVTLSEVIARFKTFFTSTGCNDGAVSPAPGWSSSSGFRVLLIDIPAAEQASIVGGLPFARLSQAETIAAEAAHAIFGGSFEARLNMNLREQKHWAYGAGSDMAQRRGSGVITVSASVRKDRAGDALLELMREVVDIGGPRGPTINEFDRFKANALNMIPAQYERARSVAAEIAGNAMLGHACDWAISYPDRIRKLTLEQVAEAASRLFANSGVTWIVSGDATVISPQLSDALGEVPERIDPDLILG